MNIVQINNCDLPGRRFNGHDLQLSLNELGYDAVQFVLDKYGVEESTIKLCSESMQSVRNDFRQLEHKLSIVNLLNPFGRFLAEHPKFQSADIVHYHLIHNHTFSLLDFPMLVRNKPSVWTVHDPWLVTGHCVYPLDCNKWETGCLECERLDDSAFPLQIDKASQLWNIKENVFKEIDVDIIICSSFMEGYLKNCLLTSHFKRIHKIPFGIDVDRFLSVNQEIAKNRFGISHENFVISFRAEKNEIKGLKYILDMLYKLQPKTSVTILAIGSGALPKELSVKYQVIELGWQNNMDIMYDFYSASDIFLMPSLAESFGLMAIEAMASGCAVIVFEDTVLEEITFAPECGIAVKYKDSDMLRLNVERLLENTDECYQRGELGIALAKKHYNYKDYVNAHIDLYKEILSRSK